MSKGSRFRTYYSEDGRDTFDAIFRKPREATEEDHAKMNCARIKQSLSDDYLKALVKATEPKIP